MNGQLSKTKLPFAKDGQTTHHEITKMNLNTHANIEQAYLTYLDYLATAEEINEIITAKGMDGTERFGGKELFAKVPARAVARMRQNARRTNSNESR